MVDNTGLEPARNNPVASKTTAATNYANCPKTNIAK